MISWSDFQRECRFLLAQRSIYGVLIVALGLSIFSVWSGLAEVNAQRDTIERLVQKDALDRADAIAKHHDYGSVAYYSFHLTYDEPSPLAFAAMGQRDVFPWKHRIRMLAIEGQIYETDADNPELSLVGRFDFAFYVSVLLPLFVILLTYSLRSSEREAGRHDLLIVTSQSQRKLWLTRAVVLNLSLFVVICVPFVISALISGAIFSRILLVLFIVFAHTVFWACISLFVGVGERFAQLHSTRIASLLVGVWLLLSVVLPVSISTWVELSVASPKGGDVVLTQREAVNDAWDLPFDATWDAFLATHPKWADSTEMTGSFEWKWYYAFQQVGDQKAALLSNAYREATQKRNELAGWGSLLSPPMLTQRLLSEVAGTDTAAMLAYESRVRDYHQSLRYFYYPLLFGSDEFSQETLSTLPQFEPDNKRGDIRH